MTILIIEDDSNQSETLAKLLIKSAVTGSVNIVCANTLAKGIQKMQSDSPDATVLDLVLPDSPNWRDTLHYLPEGKAPNRFYHPVIVTTGLDDPTGEIATECIISGADNIFFKPFCTNATKNLLSTIAAATMRASAVKVRLQRTADG